MRSTEWLPASCLLLRLVPRLAGVTPRAAIGDRGRSQKNNRLLPFSGYLCGMTTQLQELRSLPISERVQLVEDLWDSIAQDASEITLAQDQIDLLDKRLDAVDKNPREGTPWEIAKQRIISSL